MNGFVKELAKNSVVSVAVACGTIVGFALGGYLVSDKIEPAIQKAKAKKNHKPQL